ncbi:hypothetical protein [Mitsuaria sp. GD03876]|uniref:hypothetical protein n=1 Tax=Mitsuaria sp. GD03876 TaxID=2975399 RepID=UPI00244BC022|nr:hypothetical protein [Mitsuaria sp. GD03876]MDH0865092.1 hypothetical protein [Mitsuaria sp. GD03876]MDH0865098.1 hypothetical protein [Mitsuaria sp. GD03876]
MGLALQVGGFDDEDQEIFDPLSAALVEAGLPPYEEPRSPGAEAVYSCGMWGYSGLHTLRRVAAYLGEGLPIPGPSREHAASDPVLEGFYDLMAPGFEHLVLHSDCEGFYAPIRFEEVIFPSDELKVPGGMVGSAVKLLEECLRLAQWLELPTDIDAEGDEVWAAAETPVTEGPKWKRYGVESFTCIRLIRACEASIKSGAALVFC